MTRLPLRVILVVAVLAVLSGRASAQPPLVITLSDGTVGAKCMAQMGVQDKARTLHSGQSVVWQVDGTACTGFNYKHVTLDFDTDVMEGGRLLKDCVPNATQKKCTITDKVTAFSTGNSPNHSRHPYVIRYNGRNSGDPEIDISNDTGDPGPAPPRPGSGRR
jgi:hypothetical protein